MRGGCAGEIGPVRLPPRPRSNVFLRRQGINGVVQPAMPGRRHDRSLRGAAINHPASLESEPRIDLAAPRAVIAIAELVLAYELAVERGPQQRAEGRPVPPGKEAQKKGFHRLVQIGGWRGVHATAVHRSPRAERATSWRGLPALHTKPMSPNGR